MVLFLVLDFLAREGETGQCGASLANTVRKLESVAACACGFRELQNDLWSSARELVVAGWLSG